MTRMLLALSVAMVFADRASAQGTLAAEEVVRSVQAHHPRLLQEIARVEVAQGEELAARGAFDPRLSVTGTTTQSYYDYQRLEIGVDQPTPLAGARVFGGYRLTRGNVPVYFGEYETLEAGELRIGARLPLLQDLSIDAARAARSRAELDVDVANATLEATTLGLVREGLAAYYRWVASGAALRVAEELLTLAETRDAQLARMVAAGAAPAIERLENQRALLSRRARVILARQRVRQTAIALSLFLRDENGAPRVLDERALPGNQLALDAAVRDLDGAFERAAANRPEVRRYELLVERARVASRLARNGRLPRLDAQVQLSRDLGEGTDDQRSRLGGNIFEGSLSFGVPLANRTPRGRATARAAEVTALEAEQAFFLEQLRAQVQEAVVVLEGVEQALAVERENRRVAEDLAAAERRRFEAGATTMLFVNLREQLAAEAAFGVIEREADVAVARAVLLVTLGVVPTRESP